MRHGDQPQRPLAACLLVWFCGCRCDRAGCRQCRSGAKETSNGLGWRVPLPCRGVVVLALGQNYPDHAGVFVGDRHQRAEVTRARIQVQHPVLQPCGPLRVDRAAILRSRRPTATPPCGPTSRPCLVGNARSGAASTRSSCAPSPTCARLSGGTRPSMASRAKAGSSAFIASRSTSSWLSSAARHCVLFPRRVQARQSALPRHPRGRPARRSSARHLGEAG